MDGPEVASRVAWSYLAAVLASIVGGLFAVVVYQVARPLACGPITDDVADLQLDCGLLWAGGLLVVGFATAFAFALTLLKVTPWLVSWLVTLAGLAGLLAALEYSDQWWWWTALVLLPAAAALAGAPWRGARRA